MASWEILCVHCTKEKTLRLDYRWLFWVCWQHVKGDNCGTPTPPKQQWSRKILPVSELDMDLPFLPAMLLAKPSFVNLQNALFILIAFHIALLLNKKLILCPNTLQQWAGACGIHWAYHIPHRFEAAGLIGWWDGLLKTVAEPAGEQHLVGQEPHLPGCSVCTQ